MPYQSQALEGRLCMLTDGNLTWEVGPSCAEGSSLAAAEGAVVDREGVVTLGGGRSGEQVGFPAGRDYG